MTKRGSYVELLVPKSQLKWPGPEMYRTEIKWKECKPNAKNVKKIKVPLTKDTYIDQAQKQGKLFAQVGPGAYNVTKTQKQIEEQIKKVKEKKRGFFNLSIVPSTKGLTSSARCSDCPTPFLAPGTTIRKCAYF